MTFQLHCIAMLFTDIKFSNKESVTTQAFAFSKFKKHASKLPLWLPCNLDTGYRQNVKWGPYLVSQVLPCTVTFKLG